jgi:hypothetical protein
MLEPVTKLVKDLALNVVLLELLSVEKPVTLGALCGLDSGRRDLLWLLLRRPLVEALLPCLLIYKRASFQS